MTETTLEVALRGLEVLHAPHFDWGCNERNCSGQEALDKVRAALAAPSEAGDPVTPALDTERLARALHKTGAVCMRPVELCPGGRHDHDWPAAIATAYAALGPSADSLDVAWKEAEAALPEGWRLCGVNDHGGRWNANAEPKPAYKQGRSHGNPTTTWLGFGADGPTPAAALRALTDRLHDAPTARQTVPDAPHPLDRDAGEEDIDE